ncbi:MAG: hypothetical protein IT239_00585, partial [Bacteroidia bacterium]|nr:hypothetical protein [Bacteroidia bacterium]
MKKFLLIVISLFFVGGLRSKNEPGKSFVEPDPYKINAKGFKGKSDITILHISSIFKERWDTLSHVGFWRNAMQLDKDSAIISFSSNRKIVARVSLPEWKTK